MVRPKLEFTGLDPCLFIDMVLLYVLAVARTGVQMSDTVWQVIAQSSML